MAGRRQHYLPRFLQRAFRSRSERVEDFVFVHDRTGCREINTRNVCVETDFYSDRSDPASDHAITAAEGEQAQCVSDLLGPEPHRVPVERIARLVAFTSLRSRPTLDALQAFAPKTVAELDQAMTQSGFVARQVHDAPINTALMYQLADAAYQGFGDRSPAEREQIVAMLQVELGRRLASDPKGTLSQILEQSALAISQLEGRAPAMARDAFRQEFAKDPHLTARTGLFQRYEFAVMRAPMGDFFILGDCGVAALDAQCTAKLALVGFFQPQDVPTVLMPLSPCLCLVGRLPGTDQIVSVQQINQVSAMLSRRCFVSDRSSDPSLDELRNTIATAEQPYSFNPSCIRL